MKLLFLILLISYAPILSAHDPDKTHQGAEAPAIIHAYFEHLNRIFRSGSTMADVEALLALCNENIRYIHKEYEAEFNRTTWRQAFERHMQAGRYQGPADHCSTITLCIPGKGYFAIEYFYGKTKEGQCQPKDSKRLLAIFKIENDKISQIEELW